MACWIAMLQSKKVILAGDHLQLPPTIMSVEAARKGLSLTLMERAIEVLGKGIVRMLNMQYRMNTGNFKMKPFLMEILFERIATKSFECFFLNWSPIKLLLE